MPKKSSLTDEERELFRSSVGQVTPLSKGKKISVSPTKLVIPPKTRRPLVKPRYKEIHVSPFLDKQPIQDIALVGPETPLKFVRSGLQNRVIQHLKRGDFIVEAILDLHGFNLTNAEQMLEQFLAQAIDRHWRCVQIIHGKGARSEHGTPPLKNSINTWLRTYPAVLAFCSAKMTDGGAGAVYVLLKS